MEGLKETGRARNKGALVGVSHRDGKSKARTYARDKGKAGEVKARAESNSKT